MFPLHDPIDETIRRALDAYDDFTAALLVRRGVTSREEAEAFLSPSYDDHIHDPMLMTDMPKASARVAKALDTGERIAVWSDYDCDGIPGGVLLHDFLKKAGANFTNYIPHRHNEGYGVNSAGIDTLKAEGVSLIITVDSGITDNEAVAHAAALGIDVIVTDHHLPQGALPPAFAVLNPNARAEETYPYRSLCGSGVAWKLVCAVLAHGFVGREHIPLGWEKWLLDMAGLATIADMVPLTGENRVIAKYGLLVMRKSPRVGLQRLFKVARVDQRTLSEDDVAFMLAPRVNAASRMGDPWDAFHLFTATDEADADVRAKKLEATNRTRRAASGAVTRAVHERLDERRAAGTLPAVIAMGDPEWRPGLLGLVASNIADEFGCPVFLWGREGNGSTKGSCRGGPGGVDVSALMQAAGDTFTDFGGHAAAGGFSVAPDAVFDLEERLCRALATLPSNALVAAPRADLNLTPKDATPQLLTNLLRLAPFGMGNPKPTVSFENILVHQVSWFGKSGEHLRVTILEETRAPLEAIAFFARRDLGASARDLEAGTRVTLLATLERDQFTRGQPVRLRIIGLR